MPDAEQTDTAGVEETKEVVVVAPEVSPIPPPQKKKRPIVLIVIACIVVIGAVAAWLWRDMIIDTLAGRLTVQESVSTSTSSTDPTTITDPELRRFISPTTGETWTGSPKSIAPKGWFKGELASSYTAIDGLSIAEQMSQNTPTYKEVGSRAGATIVLVTDPYSGGPMAAYWLFEERADGSVAIIVKPQSTGKYDDSVLQQAKDATTNKVTVYDESTHYDSLSLPASISIGNGETVTRPEYATLQSWGLGGAEPTTNRIVKELGASNLVRVEQKYADTQLTNFGYYISTPLGTKIGVEYNPNTASLEKYTFSNGVSAQYKDAAGVTAYDTIAAIARGCGGASAAVTRSDSLKTNQLTKIGTTDTGRAVYEITDKNNSLYVKGYSEYQQAYTSNAVSFDEYVKQHGLMVIQNGAGELLVYVRGQYALGGGCAKPVVYLYPTSTTTVSVRVGAKVTVSDPLYSTNGWNGVVAQPDGTLTYKGQHYTSLFWEGVGSGVYPSISSGTVVKQADAVATIREQLVAQGLKTNEITDFLAFWSSKIPNTPYVRLTWLTTAQMNSLAPLSITPKPQTLIRVFLDMGGLERPISLSAQHFSPVARSGFTVVEWGGLTSLMK